MYWLPYCFSPFRFFTMYMLFSPAVSYCMLFAFSMTSSMVPTLKNAFSGYSSISPSMIALNPRIVSFKGTYTPWIPVKFSATWNGWDKNFWIFLARYTRTLSSSALDKLFFTPIWVVFFRKSSIHIAQFHFYILVILTIAFSYNLRFFCPYTFLLTNFCTKKTTFSNFTKNSAKIGKAVYIWLLSYLFVFFIP